MFFSVGIESPKSAEQAYGLVVPALCNNSYSCFSAADTQEEIAPMVTEAITLVLETMQEQGELSGELKDAGVLTYQAQPEYAHCDAWVLIYVDNAAYAGKPKRINISIPDTLISRIDSKVKAAPHRYRDRSHFLATAARHELNN